MKSISTGANPNEAEVPLGTTDPIVIGIARCIITVVAAEVSVKISGTSDGTAALMNTPQTQATLSRNVVPDYTFYSLVYAGVCTWRGEEPS